MMIYLNQVVVFIIVICSEISGVFGSSASKTLCNEVECLIYCQKMDRTGSCKEYEKLGWACNCMEIRQIATRSKRSDSFSVCNADECVRYCQGMNRRGSCEKYEKLGWACNCMELGTVVARSKRQVCLTCGGGCNVLNAKLVCYQMGDSFYCPCQHEDRLGNPEDEDKFHIKCDSIECEQICGKVKMKSYCYYEEEKSYCSCEPSARVEGQRIDFKPDHEPCEERACEKGCKKKYLWGYCKQYLIDSRCYCSVLPLETTNPNLRAPVYVPTCNLTACQIECTLKNMTGYCQKYKSGENCHCVNAFVTKAANTLSYQRPKCENAACDAACRRRNSRGFCQNTNNGLQCFCQNFRLPSGKDRTTLRPQHSTCVLENCDASCRRRKLRGFCHINDDGMQCYCQTNPNTPSVNKVSNTSSIPCNLESCDMTCLKRNLRGYCLLATDKTQCFCRDLSSTLTVRKNDHRDIPSIDTKVAARKSMDIHHFMSASAMPTPSQPSSQPFIAQNYEPSTESSQTRASLDQAANESIRAVPTYKPEQNFQSIASTLSLFDSAIKSMDSMPISEFPNVNANSFFKAAPSTEFQAQPHSTKLPLAFISSVRPTISYVYDVHSSELPLSASLFKSTTSNVISKSKYAQPSAAPPVTSLSAPKFLPSFSSNYTGNDRCLPQECVIKCAKYKLMGTCNNGQYCSCDDIFRMEEESFEDEETEGFKGGYLEEIEKIYSEKFGKSSAIFKRCNLQACFSHCATRKLVGRCNFDSVGTICQCV